MRPQAHWHDPGDKGGYCSDIEQDTAKLMGEPDMRLPSLMKLTKRDLRMLAMALSDAVEMQARLRGLEKSETKGPAMSDVSMLPDWNELTDAQREAIISVVWGTTWASVMPGAVTLWRL